MEWYSWICLVLVIALSVVSWILTLMFVYDRDYHVAHSTPKKHLARLKLLALFFGHSWWWVLGPFYCVLHVKEQFQVAFEKDDKKETAS